VVMELQILVEAAADLLDILVLLQHVAVQVL
jgi:hypothetical protein